MQNPGRRQPKPSPEIYVKPGHVALRILCRSSIISGLIGSSGSIISQIRRDTSTLIHCQDPVPFSDHRVIVIVGPVSPKRRILLEETKEEGNDEDGRQFRTLVSRAQEAVLSLVQRMWEVDAEKVKVKERKRALSRDQEDESSVGSSRGYCGVLANTTQIGAVVGKGGRNIVRMRGESGARIKILPAPQCASKDDELIQITGGILAAKTALVYVTSCLQNCQPLGPTRPIERPHHPPSPSPSPSSVSSSTSDQHSELFLNHLSLSSTPPKGSPVNSWADSDDEGWNRLENVKPLQGEVSFRLLCSNAAAGSIIGNRGSVVRDLENQTGASISFAAPITASGERVVTVFASENLHSLQSPARNAVTLVFVRSIQHDIEQRAPKSGQTTCSSVTARLLVPSKDVCCLSGKNGDRVDVELGATTGADIRVLEGEEVLDCASGDDAIVQISGNYQSVQNALFLVTGKLRDGLLPSDVLYEVRPTSPCKRMMDVTSKVKQSVGLSTDCNQQTSLMRQMDQLGLCNNIADYPSPGQQPQQVICSNAAKKSLVSTVRPIQDFPLSDKDRAATHLSRPVKRTRPPPSVSSTSDFYSKFFPNLKTFLPPLMREPVNWPSQNKESNWKHILREVSFRLLCMSSAVGSIIGEKGSIVRCLQNETGASILSSAPITAVGERIVTISASENLKSLRSPAQNALVLVFARSIEHAFERGRTSRLTVGGSVTARLLVALDDVCCLSGKNGDLVDPEMVEIKGADIQVLDRNEVFDGISPDDVIVQISGEYQSVQNALLHVTSKLRASLLPNDVLPEMKATSQCKRMTGFTPMVQQSAELSVEPDWKPGLVRLDQLGLSDSMGDRLSCRQLAQERLEGCMANIICNEGRSTTPGDGSEIERPLHFSLPKEALNEVGGKNSFGGIKADTCPEVPLTGLYATSNQKLKTMQKNKASKDIGSHPSPGLQTFQTAGRSYSIATIESEKCSRDFEGSIELESGRKTPNLSRTSIQSMVPEKIFDSACSEDNLARLRQISGATVDVCDPSHGKSERAVVIRGTADQTMVAQSLLQAFILADQ